MNKESLMKKILESNNISSVYKLCVSVLSTSTDKRIEMYKQ